MLMPKAAMANQAPIRKSPAPIKVELRSAAAGSKFFRIFMEKTPMSEATRPMTARNKGRNIKDD